MNKLFLPYELALMAKEKGFDEECLGFWRSNKEITFQSYSNNIISHRNTFLTIKGKENFIYTPEPKDADTNPNYERLKWGIKVVAPLYQQIIDWFWDKHEISVFPYRDNRGMWYNITYDGSTKSIMIGVKIENGLHHYQSDYFSSWQDCQNKAIEEAFKLI